uniref:Uncharacterized protein n=1 Tax=Anguilla anguilla TaxID=7936 RepID=A0A0E9XGG7_ANGAN
MHYKHLHTCMIAKKILKQKTQATQNPSLPSLSQAKKSPTISLFLCHSSICM